MLAEINVHKMNKLLLFYQSTVPLILNYIKTYVTYNSSADKH